MGRAAGLYTYSPTLQIAGGVMATGRTDFPVMPIGGLIWTPSPDWRHEIIFPKPKLRVVLPMAKRPDWWGYTAGEFGGNSYAIESAWGANDIATYRDLRFHPGARTQRTSGAVTTASKSAMSSTG